MNNYTENLLRGLPIAKGSYYVLREQFNNTICNQLKRIDQSGGHILVHGISGCGKTIAVCQAVRQVILEENCFKPCGCYWTKIGTKLADFAHLLYSENIIIKVYG